MARTPNSQIVTSPIAYPRSRHATHKLARLSFSLAIALSFAGCGGEESKEISAETSGYQVADSDSSSSAAAAKPEGSTPAPASPTTPSPTTPAPAPGGNDSLANQAAKPPATGATTPGAAANPEMNRAGGVVNEAPSFTTLQFPASEDSAELIAFLLKTDQAIRDLAVYGSQGMIPEADFRQQGARVLEMKLTAANKLLGKTDLNEKDVRLAHKAKLQALSQLSSLGDVRANEQLRTYVDDIVKTGDAELIHNARLMQLGYAAEALMGGKSTDPNELLSRIDEVLSDENYRGAAELMQVRAATGLLEQMGFKDQATAVRQKVGKLYENNKDPNLANAAWQILAEQHPATNAMRDAMAAVGKGEASGVDQVKAAAEQMVAELPPERTLIFLVSQIVNIEFSGQPEAAGALVDVVNANLDKLTDPTMKEQVVKTFDSFKLRQGIIGKDLPLTGLVDMEGKAFDWGNYSGKVVLVDFWATWCGPCLQELPNVQKAYESLKEKGFEVVGVNLDENKADLDNFLKATPLAWTTFRSGDAEKVGFNTPVAKELGVDAIPFVVLVGKDGKVAKLHVRGEKLVAAIEELLQ